MIKEELLEKKPMLKYNLQFHAGEDDGDGSDNAGDNGDDNQDDDDQGEDNDNSDDDKKSDKKKYFTQEELDKAIKNRLKRERENQKKQTQTKTDKQDNKNSDDKAKDTDDKVSALEAKLLCFEHDVSKDSVSDVVALAKSYVDEDTDFEEAIEKVIKKYPQFIKGSGKNNYDTDDDTDNKKGSWGDRQKGKSKKVSGVEAAFLKNNPGLEID